MRRGGVLGQEKPIKRDSEKRQERRERERERDRA
jgi:hypothetical protein